MLPPGSSWLPSNVPNAEGKGQPSRCAAESFPSLAHLSPHPSGEPGGQRRDHDGARCRGRQDASGRLTFSPGAWCNGSTTGSGPVSRGSNPCAPASEARTSPFEPGSLQTQADQETDEHHREAHAEQRERLSDLAP